jgi:hypothetical protein
MGRTSFALAHPRIIKSVRRFLCCLVLASFAFSLHASVPALKSPATLNRPVDIQFESLAQGRPALELTAAPADVSFYEEFYPLTVVRQEQPKTGVLHWFGSMIKKGRQKIALLSPQKFF